MPGLSVDDGGVSGPDVVGFRGKAVARGEGEGRGVLVVLLGRAAEVSPAT